MSVERDHEVWSEDLAAYCLGALKPGDAAELECHLSDCERCRSELRSLRPAVDALPQSIERLEPPPELRRRLMAEVREDAAGGLAVAPTGGRGLGSRLRDRLQPSGRPLGLRPLVGLAAILLIAAAAIGYSIGDGGSPDRQGPERFVSGQAPGVVAELLSSADRGRLRLTNVRPLPDERVLQAWIQRGGKVTPVRSPFVPNREGRATTTIANLQGAERVMVTTEPPGGSESPTSAPIAAVSLE